MGYVDTSVLAAYYCPEPLTAAAQKAIMRIKVPAISVLVEVELASALSQKVRSGQMDASSASKVFHQFQIHLASNHYELLLLSSQQYALARDWLTSFTTPLRALDALHLAIASSSLRTLITADKSLAHSAQQLSIKCQLIH